MARLYLILGLLALGVFAQAQYRGYGLFDEVAASQSTRPGTGGRGSFHK